MLDTYMTKEQQDKVADALKELCAIGFGEVRIVVIQGHVRLLRKLVSENMEARELKLSAQQPERKGGK